MALSSIYTATFLQDLFQNDDLIKGAVMQII